MFLYFFSSKTEYETVLLPQGQPTLKDDLQACTWE